MSEKAFSLKAQEIPSYSNILDAMIAPTFKYDDNKSKINDLIMSHEAEAIEQFRTIAKNLTTVADALQKQIDDEKTKDLKKAFETLKETQGDDFMRQLLEELGYTQKGKGKSTNKNKSTPRQKCTVKYKDVTYEVNLSGNNKTQHKNNIKESGLTNEEFIEKYKI